MEGKNEGLMPSFLSSIIFSVLSSTTGRLGKEECDPDSSPGTPRFDSSLLSMG